MQSAIILLATLLVAASAQLIPPKPVVNRNCLAHQQLVDQQQLLGAFRPTCDADGTYSPMQYHASTGMRFCMSTTGVKITEPSRTLRACVCPRQRFEATATNRVGQFVPKCEADGTYSHTQIHASTGYTKCFTPEGIQFFSARGLRSCKCMLERHLATAHTGMVGMFVAKCEADGSYSKRQCHGSTGYCHCVNEEGEQVGNAIPPTSMVVLNCQ